VESFTAAPPFLFDASIVTAIFARHVGSISRGRMMSKPNLTNFQSKFLKFDSLMQARVKHVLLVSSPYDSFVLEEDGQLTELIYNEYLELNLSATPNVKRASNSEEALDILTKQDIDLVIIFKRVGDLDVVGFGHDVKSIKPDMPVVFLAYHRRELAIMETTESRSAIDWVNPVQDGCT